MNRTNEVFYLADQPALTEFCAGLRGIPWLALDTEFIREQTYYAQLCLIQVASPDRIACIDPLALPSLEPLLEILYDPAITKILHAAYQDLEIFHDLNGHVPAPVFDTQLAATALSYGDQVGYANLAWQMLGVDLEKTHTRVNWQQRPLQPEWLAYAADDVRYLGEIYQRQQALLAEQGRIGELTESFAALADPARYESLPQEAWRRVRDHRRLRRNSQQAVLRALAAWREKQAIDHDRPRRWILHDGPLLDMARRMPTDLDQLAQIRGLPTTTLRRHGQALLALIAAAQAEISE